MNRKLTPLILATLAALSLTGCSDEFKPQTTCSNDMFIFHDIGSGYVVLEDEYTGVCYIGSVGMSKEYLTVMLNPDGTPRTWSEIEGQDADDN